jgi:hypothetical protein
MTVVNIKGYDVMLDDEDVEKISGHTWGVNKWAEMHYGLKYFTRTTRIYDMHHKVTGYHVLRMHRYLMGEEDRNVLIDHIDGNTLNCQKSNLRRCTHTENCRNTKLNKNSTSGYKGVRWHKKGKKWEAHITVQRRFISLGLYDNIIDAALVYNKKASELFGEFARLNNMPKECL